MTKRSHNSFHARLLSGVSGFIVSGVVLTASAGVLYFGTPLLLSVSYEAPQAAVATSTSETPTQPTAEHLPTPEPLKAIYMTQCVAGTPSFRADLVRLVEETELNAIVVDIKDFSGGIAFPTENPALAPYVSKKCGAADMRDFVKSLHEKGIYVIGRITVFQDPLYASAHPELAVKKESDGSVWKDHKGLAFIDVGARPFWDYIVTLAKESYALGFDELNFDYIRYPSDGNMKDISFMLGAGEKKADKLEQFFAYLSEQLRPLGVVTSADLFGYTTVHEDDLGIGQLLERAFPHFDYIAPMTYPSHYNSGFAGLANVNSDPYRVIKVSIDAAVERARATTTKIFSPTYTPLMKTIEVPATASTPTTTTRVATGLYTKPAFPAGIIRPWLQSFDYPVPYTPAMVAAQIQANSDAGLTSYMFWDAGNRYSSLRSVLNGTYAPATTTAP